MNYCCDEYKIMINNHVVHENHVLNKEVFCNHCEQTKRIYKVGTIEIGGRQFGVSNIKIYFCPWCGKKLLEKT